MNEITTEAFNIMLQCVARAPASALKLISTCSRCQEDVRIEILRPWGGREDLRHRLMVTLLAMEENHEYLLHGSGLSDDDSEAEAGAAKPEFITAAYRGNGAMTLHYRGSKSVPLPARVVRSIIMELRVRDPALLEAPPEGWHLSDDDSEPEADAAEQRAQFTEPLTDDLAQALDDLGPPGI